MTITYILSSSVGVLETSCSMAEVSAMLAGTAAAPVVSGPRLIAIDIGGDTIALDVAEIVDYSPSPFADELTIQDAAQVTDQANGGVTAGQRHGPGRRKKGG